jgi:hypothetical protein
MLVFEIIYCSLSSQAEPWKATVDFLQFKPEKEE